MSHVENFQTKLVITGEDTTPVQIWNTATVQRHDLKTTDEEADVIIIHHLVRIGAAINGYSNIKVICDDTDVLLLLVHFYIEQQMTINVTMEGPNTGRSIIDIDQTAQKHHNIAKYLLAAHALTGCDTMSCMYGIREVTSLKTLVAGHQLPLLGQLHADEANLISEATTFIADGYGSKATGDMNSHRLEFWKVEVANPKIKAAPKLTSLPPTKDAFAEHVYRAHYQVMIWKSANLSDPPAIDTEIVILCALEVMVFAKIALSAWWPF